MHCIAMKSLQNPQICCSPAVQFFTVRLLCSYPFIIFSMCSTLFLLGMGNEAYTNPHPPLTQTQFGLVVFCESSSYWLTGGEDDSDEVLGDTHLPWVESVNAIFLHFPISHRVMSLLVGLTFPFYYIIWPLKNIERLNFNQKSENTNYSTAYVP